MKAILLLCFLALFGAEAIAVDIAVGSTQLSIPAPADFVPVTSEMGKYAELAKRFVPPSNEQYALFITRENAAMAMEGKIPAASRRFAVQTAKEIIPKVVTSAEFSQMKGAVNAQNQKVFDQVEAKMPGLLAKVNKGISDDYSVNMSLSLNKMLPLPTHNDTERSMAFSMFVKYDAEVKGKPKTFEGVVTTTFLHLKGKVLFLYCYADKTDLEWSRVESQKWVDAIFAANPSIGSTASSENQRSGSSKIDWSQVGISGLIAGLISGVVGIFKSKKQKS